MILMATMFDFSLEEQRGLIGFLNSWNYGVSLYIIISLFKVIICRKYNCIFFRFPFGWEDKGTPGEGRCFLNIEINRAFIKIIAYTVKPTGSLYKHSGDYINDALDSSGSYFIKFLSIPWRRSRLTHIS